MDIYNSIAEKTPHFASNRIINSNVDFETLRQEFELIQSNSLRHCVFRGVNEAKYKLYNSAQREWASWDMGTIGENYEDHIINMINSCKNSESLLEKYYKRLGIIRNDWLILSFLQHYSAPSPLLDFSKDYKTAFFFASSNVNGNHGNTDDISNYISIYYFEFVNEAKKIETLVHYAKRTIAPMPAVSGRDTQIWDDELSYERVMQDCDALLIPSYSHVTELKNSNHSIVTKLMTSNLRSTCQDGEFVCSKSQNEPVEDLFQRKGAKLHCVNIHKALAHYIENTMFDGAIENARQKYFQNEEDIAHLAKLKFLLLN